MSRAGPGVSLTGCFITVNENHVVLAHEVRVNESMLDFGGSGFTVCPLECHCWLLRLSVFTGSVKQREGVPRPQCLEVDAWRWVG